MGGLLRRRAEDGIRAEPGIDLQRRRRLYLASSTGRPTTFFIQGCFRRPTRRPDAGPVRVQSTRHTSADLERRTSRKHSSISATPQPVWQRAGLSRLPFERYRDQRLPRLVAWIALDVPDTDLQAACTRSCRRPEHRARPGPGACRYRQSLREKRSSFGETLCYEFSGFTSFRAHRRAAAALVIASRLDLYGKEQ